MDDAVLREVIGARAKVAALQAEIDRLIEMFPELGKKKYGKRNDGAPSVLYEHPPDVGSSKGAVGFERFSRPVLEAIAKGIDRIPRISEATGVKPAPLGQRIHQMIFRHAIERVGKGSYRITSIGRQALRQGKFQGVGKYSSKARASRRDETAARQGKAKKPYGQDLIDGAIARVKAGEANNAVARDIGVPASTLKSWRHAKAPK